MKYGKLPSRLLSLVLCVCMVLSLMPMMPLVAEAATTPTYIASIGIAQDGSLGSTGVNDCKSELSGHTIINRDLNDGAGGDYVYMGYKTTTDPSKAITGIVFRVGKNPPNSITYGGSTFYLVGSSSEPNTAVDNVVDLNADAGGDYIYTYVTRDPDYGPALTNLTVNTSSSYSGWSTGTNTGGNVIDLNQKAGGDYLYLHYQRYSATIRATYYYIDGNGTRQSTTLSKTANNHLDTLTGAPSISGATYNGRNWTHMGWRDDDDMAAREYIGNDISVSVSESGKAFRAQYIAWSGIAYSSNGGSETPDTVYYVGMSLYACSSSIKGGYTDYTLAKYNNPTHPSKCKFLGWSENPDATTATYPDGGTIRLIEPGHNVYAVWDPTHTPGGSYTNLGSNHSYGCTDCGKTIKENHSYNSTTRLCVCGAVSPDAVASVSKNGVVTGAYTTLNDAIQAVADCTASDQAVLKLLKTIDLGDSYQSVRSGVFTIDLNGFEISSTVNYGTLSIRGTAPDVTVQDSGEDGKITGNYAGIEVRYGTLTVLGGTISGSRYSVYSRDNSTVTISGGSISGSTGGVYASNSTVTVNDGTISGEGYGVYVDYNSTVTISGGTISSDQYGVFQSRCTMTISGGSISGGTYDIYNSSSTATLTLGDNGVGATFPGGIEVGGTTLNEILGTGAAYWQGSTMILPANGATEITGGDVVIKSTCPHTASKSNYTDLKDGAKHTYVCSGCNSTVTEAHSYNATTLLCACGAASPDAVASVSKNGVITGAYTSLNDAIQAVANCTADDQAVVKLLKDIPLGDNYQRISSGVFTIDLNGCELSSTKSFYGVLCIDKAAANVTIQDSGEHGKITGNYAGIEVRAGTLTIAGGTVSASGDGVMASNCTVTICGGTVSASGNGVDAVYCTVTICGGTVSGYNGVDATGCTVTINTGTISASDDGVYATGGSTLTINGGTISGDNGVDAYNHSTVTISGGTISSSKYGVYASYNSTVTVSGGSISGNRYDIYNSGSTVTLILGENGVGATFPGGIKVRNTTLNGILGDGAAYWQGDKQINPADGTKEISGGDVTIKAYVAPVYSGWTEINGDWYYYDPDTNTPVTGITRVPYPTEAIDGVTYAPDQESIDYAASKGQTFIDETTGLFWFDTNFIWRQ